MTNNDIIEKIKLSDLTKYENLKMLFEVCLNILTEDKDLAIKTCKLVKNKAAMLSTDMRFFELYNQCLLFLAPYCLDEFMCYIEKDRDPDKRFWLPRRNILKPTADDMQKLIDDEYDLLAISMPPGSGKAQPLYSKVLTPNGFINMGDVKTGDEVIAGNGNISKITGVYPQGKRRIYRVHFNDNTYTDCSDEHLWTVQTRDDRRKDRGGEKYRTTTLNEMLKHIGTLSDGHSYYSIDYVKPIEFMKKELPIHPYVLGVLIGDGSLQKQARFTNTESDIVEKVRLLLRDDEKLTSTGKDQDFHAIIGKVTVRNNLGYLQKSNITNSLERYGLIGKGSYEKFVPTDYLNSCVEDRIELLRGLIDTDGYVSKSGSIEYSTTSERLKDDILYLVQSLGGYATFKLKQGAYKKNGERIETRKYYRMIIEFPSTLVPASSEKHLVKYNVKRDSMRRFITKIEYIGDDECQCIMIDDECHLYITDNFIITHNTTLGIFFLSWVMGKFPEQPNLASAHADKLTRSFYDGVLQIITDPEYKWHDVFPTVKLEGQNANDETINLGSAKRFKSLTARPIGGSLTGATRCEKILYADDLCSGIEEAMSKDRLDKLWEKYANDLKSRKKQECKEIHIATRWSVWDIIGRLERMYEGNPRAKFIVLPALNEQGESNFNYQYGVGFDMKYFEDMRNNLDDVSFRCLFMNQPIEREGLLYHEDELRRYFELPKGVDGKLIEPDTVLSICDTKDTGTDYEFLPIAYQYGTDFYIDDCLCDNSKTEVLDELCAKILVKHKVKASRFESNNAGGRTADVVQSRVKELGGFTHITKRFTTSNKETKIIVNSPYVKEHFLFKDKTMYKPQSDYWKMMNFLCTYTMMGKNRTDDVPDGMAQLAMFIQSLTSGQVEVFKRPF